MKKVISIIGQSNAESLMFILEFAKIIELLERDVALVGDAAYQSLLFDYSFDIVEISNIKLYQSIELAAEEVVLHNGYVADATHYIILLKHDMFCVKALSRSFYNCNIDEAIFVLIDELDVAWRLNYVYSSYFARFVQCPIRVAFAIDECAKERLFASQIKQQIALNKMSRVRIKSYQKLLNALFVEEGDKIKVLKKLIKRS